MYDNISDFTRYDDDHDPEHGEEEVLQTSIKTGKVLTQSLIIDTKDGEVDVLQELKKNTSSGGGGRHELEINEIEEKLAEKADKEHKHNISDINELQATLNSKADKNELDAMNKVLKSHKHNISDINELQTSLDNKADKNHTHESFTTVRADDIILNYDLGSSAPLENPSTSVKDTLNSLNGKCMNIEDHARNFEAHELPAMLDKKADKNHTHKSFTTVRADDIILNFDLGSSAPLENPSTSVKDTLNNLDKSCRNIEDHARNFEAYELPTMLDKKADKTELQTLKTEILQTLYPIGSIYTSMNSTNPASVLGFGTWQQIVDKFLYCANFSKQTGGSKKITEANLPPHTHTGTTNFSGDHSHSLRDHPLYNSEYEAGNDVLSPSYNNAAKKTFRQTEPGGNHVHTFTTNPTGSGADYMPPFVTVFAWYRVQ
ncbi:hypothetical protein TVAG_428130 [Trichomonas vaginalis G3]|uniref:Baseplate structural protein Gp10 C-terminal domain-containing protein n=1 Tax=Trichomonas vaginalis (strain ATCC PRA-98 / G3) TaxID=412133 RepID=A2GSK8_TRIV3|nr:keratin-associated protein family [Trichomonas vaginalis G3]EAX79859.1 hypothetical protein TVAG_428130 [Trichomonas vaginalis G3]KAI5512854.1 keratin-associated protein family [Trichomonas vaginalis G3]|eukprot:XP_001292789.1 hypothetical protein [Trichomonas vaginalis G3]